jgi:hypothetical protein
MLGEDPPHAGLVAHVEGGPVERGRCHAAPAEGDTRARPT